MSISIVDIPVSQLEPNPHNPRRDVGDVRELADSIRAQGIKQELLVTPSGDRDGRPMYRVVKAYSLFARPLPVVDKDPEHGVYTLNVAENALELRRRQSVPSRRGVELLLLLLARREGAIDADTWDREAYQCDLKGLNAYYEVLESAGYAVSDAEMKGLEQ